MSSAAGTAWSGQVPANLSKYQKKPESSLSGFFIQVILEEFFVRNRTDNDLLELYEHLTLLVCKGQPGGGAVIIEHILSGEIGHRITGPGIAVLQVDR